MNALFDICCGEIEEETKPGAFVDDDSSDDENNTDRRRNYLHSNSSSLEKARVAMKIRRQERVTVYSKPINVQSSQYETFSPKVYEKTPLEIDFLTKALKSHFIFEELHPEYVSTSPWTIQQMIFGCSVLKRSTTQAKSCSKLPMLI